MRSFPVLLALVVLSCGVANAQTKAQESLPRLEFFGGYSFLHQSSNGEFQGWDGSLSGNFNRWFALKADFSGHYASEEFPAITFPPPFTFTVPAQTFHQSIHYFLGGPEVSYRRAKWKVYAHALAGASHGRQSFSVHNPPPGTIIGNTSISDTGLAFAVGGGGDWMFTRRFGWRVGQIDYIWNRFNGNNENNLRVSTGLVFRF